MTTIPCEGNGEPWFEESTTKAGNAARAEVIAACQACPVREQCLELAMKAEAGQPASNRYGVFGGLTPEERANADGVKRRTYSKAVCGTESGYSKHRANGEPTCQACRTAATNADRLRKANRREGVAA